MSINALPRDVWGTILADRGTRVGVDKRTYYEDADPVALQFPHDVKHVSIYVDSGGLVIRGLDPIGQVFFDDTSLTDEGDGTVSINATGHGFKIDGTDSITLVGTAPTATGADTEPTGWYDGTWPLLVSSDADTLNFSPDQIVCYATADEAVVDNEDGTVTLKALHWFAEGDSIQIDGTTNYDNAYTTLTGTDPATGEIIITATYVEETLTGTETFTGFSQWPIPATAYAYGYRDITYAAGSMIDVPMVIPANTKIFDLSASTGANCVVSILTWR